MKTSLLPVKHSEFVLSRLNQQRNTGLFCDAVLIVEGEQFRVHRSFLAANSDYFLALFSSANEQENFVLAGVPLQGFRVLLDFVYTSTFVLNSINVQDVYKASTALGFRHVKNACEKVYKKIHLMKKSNSCCNLVQRKPASKKREIKEDEKPEDLSKHKRQQYQDLKITSSTKMEHSSDNEAYITTKKPEVEQDVELNKPFDLTIQKSKYNQLKNDQNDNVIMTRKDFKPKKERNICQDNPLVNPPNRPFVDIRKNKGDLGLKRKAMDDVLVMIDVKDGGTIRPVKSSTFSKDLVKV